jgi:hypothetical protein
MTRTTQACFRRFAPCVLAASLLFVVLSDAAAGCLAAWICSPPQQEECEGMAADAAFMPGGAGVCAFKLRIDHAFRLEPIALKLIPAASPSLEDPYRLLVGRLGARPSSPGSAQDSGPPLPLYRLQSSLLI